MVVPDGVDEAVSRIAAAIGEPARARILYCLMDNRARTATELAVVAEVSPSTAKPSSQPAEVGEPSQGAVQGRNRDHALEGPEIARVLEGLSVLAGGFRGQFVPRTPQHLRAARTCYDHMAGALGVSLHDCFRRQGWLSIGSADGANAYGLTPQGAAALRDLGIDVEAARVLRRRFAYACLDWSERRSHIGGALGAALLKLALRKRWVTQDPGSRTLCVTGFGRREMRAQFGLRL